MSDILSSVRRFYDEAGEYFSKTRQKRYGKDSLWPEIRPYVKKLSEGDKVLDLGCGNGRLLSGIDVEIDYLGVDFSKTLIKEARKLHPNRKFLDADITSDKFWKEIVNKSYDAIFCVAVFHHLPTREVQIKLLKQMKGHLKKDGFIYISMWNLWQRRYWGEHLKSFNMKFRNLRWINIPFQNKWQRFCFAHDKRYFREIAKEAGVKLSEMRYVDRNGDISDKMHGNNLIAIVK